MNCRSSRMRNENVDSAVPTSDGKYISCSYSYGYEVNKRVIPMKYFPWEAIH